MKIHDQFIERFQTWAADQNTIQAVALVGSCARGTARADSDVDLVIVVANLNDYLRDNAWVAAFGTVKSIEHEDWGLVQSKRVFYEEGLEVEFGITTPEWIQIQPLDAGTAAVIRDGLQILYDPNGALQALQNAVNQT